MPLLQTTGNVTADAFGGGVAVVPNYIEDVFSTYLYTGNGTTQTINNGIDLSGKGGLVWLKSRTVAFDYYLQDTASGADFSLASNTTWGSFSSGQQTSFNSNGFTLSGFIATNGINQTYASWTFRKQPKFFDVVTWTGNGANRTIAHNLGSVPGCIIVKRTDAAANWQVYHNSLTSAAYSIQLNLIAAQASAPTIWNSTAPTSSVFSVGTDATVNASGGTYVAYIYAHNAGGFGLSGKDNVISCGSVTTDGSGNATISLGYEPQWLLVKDSTSNNQYWQIVDTMRGLNVAAVNAAELYAGVAQTESVNGGFSINATGFNISQYISTTYIYIAIRRGPMKVPTDGTKVYKAIARTGTGAIGSSTSFGQITDFVITKQRSSTQTWAWTDRLRGATLEISSADTSAESTKSNDIIGFDSMVGFNFGYGSAGLINTSASPYVDNLFKRASGFFDVVCWIGTSAVQTVSHNLTVAPELIIAADRTIGQVKPVGGTVIPNTNYLILGTTAASSSANNVWNNTSPTATNFTVNNVVSWINNAGDNNVAYLFASCPGVSKVGSYTGNGTTQAIACGFAGGARFVLIKRTDATGDWYVWDSARGIVAGNEQHLSLNTAVAEVTTDNSVDPDSSGFIVNQVAATNINVTSATYIFLAIA